MTLVCVCVSVCRVFSTACMLFLFRIPSWKSIPLPGWRWWLTTEVCSAVFGTGMFMACVQLVSNSIEKTNGQSDASVCLVVRCVCQGVHPIRGTKHDASYKFKRGRKGDKNPWLTNKYTKFEQLIIRKIIKIIATRGHMHQIRFLMSVRLSRTVCQFVS